MEENRACWKATWNDGVERKNVMMQERMKIISEKEVLE